MTSRRTALLAAAGTVLAAAGCTPLGGGSPARQMAPVRHAPPAGPFPRTNGPLVMQVLAHPDDDLFFMNPDTLHSLQAGVPVVSVYVTAGESVGFNSEPKEPHHHKHRDLAGYSASRHQGLRQAYATMLGLPHFTPWRTEVLALADGGPHVEVDSLSHGGQQAHLVFLQVSMHEMKPGANLPLLWSRPGTVLPYVVAEGAPAPSNTAAAYTHELLVDVLVQLLEHYRPSLVRTLDPDPDMQVHNAANPKDIDQVGYSDHRDHTATALFTWKALARWAAGGKPGSAARQFTTAAYRGYYNQRWPFNLPPATVALKARYLFQYGGDDRWKCGSPGGCGDYGQGRNTPLTNPRGWVRSTHPRYPGALPAVVGDTSYEVLGTRAVRRRRAAGGWGPAEDLGGGPLAPKVSAVAVPGGGTMLLALRFSVLEGHGGRNARDVVLWRDGAWTSLGSPEITDDRSRRVGPPVALATADGSVHVFVRNADKALSTRVYAAGAWGPWQDLGGREVQEGLAALTDREGRIHVFAAGHDTVRHWAQPVPSAPVVEQPPTGFPRPGDIPAAALAPDGGIVLTYRKPASATVYRETLPL